MFVCVSSVNVVSSTGSGLATGLISRSMSPTSSRLILVRNMPEDQIRKVVVVSAAAAAVVVVATVAAAAAAVVVVVVVVGVVVVLVVEQK
jgi:hypothetical protein